MDKDTIFPIPKDVTHGRYCEYYTKRGNNMLYFSSDYHFCHDRDFIYKPRGFNSVEEMQEAIIERNNSIVTDDDDLYILGDITMGQDLDTGIECLQRLHGKKHIILGNHDSVKKTEAYKQVPNVEVLGYAAVIRYRKRQIYLCHYPTLVANTADGGKHLRDLIFNFFGHTHQQDAFFHPDGDPNRTIPTMYHVGVDAHDCYPVAIEQIINEIWSQYRNQPFKQE